MTITISLGFFVVLCISLGFFILASWFGHGSGLFEDDYLNPGAWLSIVVGVYAIAWVIPTMIAVGVWAIWFR